MASIEQNHPCESVFETNDTMKTKRTIKVLVVDDHMIVRRGIVALLSLNKEFEVVGEAPEGESALRLIRSTDPDVVIMDIAMPVKDGLETTREIRTKFPRVKVLALSGYDHGEYVHKILASGAHGYLLKTTSPEELYTAVKAVCDDNAFFSPRISKILLESYAHHADSTTYSHKKESEYKGPLSEREREILRYIALGKTHQEIAKELHISVRTVDTHRNNIMRKTDIHDTASLVRYAIKEGIVSLT